MIFLPGPITMTLSTIDSTLTPQPRGTRRSPAKSKQWCKPHRAAAFHRRSLLREQKSSHNSRQLFAGLIVAPQSLGAFDVTSRSRLQVARTKEGSSAPLCDTLWHSVTLCDPLCRSVLHCVTLRTLAAKNPNAIFFGNSSRGEGIFVSVCRRA